MTTRHTSVLDHRSQVTGKVEAPTADLLERAFG